MRISGEQAQPSSSSFKRLEFDFPVANTNVQLNSVELDSVKEQELNQLVEKYNKTLQENGTALKVSIHEKTRSIVVKIVDIKTDEVIKEIPPEKMLDLVYNLCQNLGIFVDEKR
ncbi:flagellar protein FlaG [Paenibacillus sp. DYY-L-2]|uniref:flagellar protein FlaG n=1 Tax=Paenibacillus sp. DYY-L-2 TaxID=3447013 RepID=UPI003F4F517F